MKRTFCIGLVLVLLLSFTACGGASKRYEDLIGYIEANDSVNAHREVDALLAENKLTGTTLESIPITLENFEEYFEFTVDESWKENAFGEVEGLLLVSNYALKDAYAGRVGDCQIALEVSYTLCSAPITVDFENRSYLIGEPFIEEDAQVETATVSIQISPQHNPNGMPTTSPGEWGIPVIDGNTENVTVYLNPTVIRVKGTLMLLGEG